MESDSLCAFSIEDATLLDFPVLRERLKVILKFYLGQGENTLIYSYRSAIWIKTQYTVGLKRSRQDIVREKIKI